MFGLQINSQIKAVPVRHAKKVGIEAVNAESPPAAPDKGGQTKPTISGFISRLHLMQRQPLSHARLLTKLLPLEFLQTNLFD